MPLRVNWGGGWSDTPPYCNENGGTVLNVAILLNGEKPVEVTLEKIDELKIVFDSRDMDVHGEFDTIDPLQATGDPFDPFALQKACLLACGIIPKEGHELSEILKRLGGGFVMHSEVTNVPKGSGLGTSSILSAACVKAVFEFMGIEYTEEDLYKEDVLQAFRWILQNRERYRIRIVNISVGTTYRTRNDQDVLVQGVERLWDEGLVVVAAAGNQGPKPGSVTAPGCSKKIITVGSSDMLSGKQAVSGRGPTFECVCKPDLVAPGRQIMACTPGAGNLYSMKSGTSMSTPLVSGAIALALEKDSLLSNVEIKMMLRDSCDDMGLPRNQQGWGKFNCKKFLAL